MVFVEWLARNFSNLAIAAGLFANAYNIYFARMERKLQTEATLVEGHRDIWSRVIGVPSLARVIDPKADVEALPITLEEELQVMFWILHARLSFKARTSGMKFSDDHVELDHAVHFAFPIPRAVWNRVKAFQDPAFVNFIDRCIGASDSKRK